MKLDLLDPRLFGNEAGDDEDERTLASYFVEKPEFEVFESSTRSLAICRARKGMGKSALLNYIGYTKSLLPGNIAFKLKGPKLIENLSESARSPHDWLPQWREAILNVSHETQDKITNKDVSVFDIPEEDSYTLRDVLAKTDNITWVCIDDVDATYRKSPEEDLRLAAFFSCCRNLTSEYKNLRLRVSVRQDVWVSIRAVDEALDKCEQYIVDIEWSRTGTRSIIARRLKHYFSVIEFEGISDRPNSELSEKIRTRYFSQPDKAVMLRLFPELYPWGRGTAEPYQVIHALSAGRPRWAIQLMRMTARETVKAGDHILKYGYMKQILPKYSQFRINDIIREHIHQCAQIENLIYSFSNHDPIFSTAELIIFVEKNITRLVDVYLDRDEKVAGSLEIAHFLFRVGFLEAVDLRQKVIHYHYESAPQLLRSVTAAHDHLSWEVRPSYRAGLNAMDNLRFGHDAAIADD